MLMTIHLYLKDQHIEPKSQKRMTEIYRNVSFRSLRISSVLLYLNYMSIHCLVAFEQFVLCVYLYVFFVLQRPCFVIFLWHASAWNHFKSFLHSVKLTIITSVFVKSPWSNILRFCLSTLAGKTPVKVNAQRLVEIHFVQIYLAGSPEKSSYSE